MILLIVLALALTVLIMGFLGIKLPFTATPKRGNTKADSEFMPEKQSLGLNENLVKDAVDITIMKTKVVKKKATEVLVCFIVFDFLITL